MTAGPEGRLQGRAASAANEELIPHAVVFCVCAGMLLGTLLLGAVSSVDSAVSVGSIQLPRICTFHDVTGIPCPGCGLTRSWVALAQGKPTASIGYHRLGWLVMLYVALQAVRHGSWLAFRSWRSSADRAGWWLDRGIVALAVALLVNWVVTLAR